MKVVAICGSQREKSNTAFYLQKILNHLSESGFSTRFISLKDKQIRGCRGCYQCIQAKECTWKDDFQDIFQQMIEADGLLLGSPVYHSSITAELKALLDRAGFSGRWMANEMKAKDQAYNWTGNAFSGKVIAPVTVARRAGQNFAFAQLLLWATCNECIVVGSSYWNVGVAGKGGAVDADQDEEGLGIMRNLATNMAHVLRAMDSYRQNPVK